MIRREIRIATLSLVVTVLVGCGSSPRSSFYTLSAGAAPEGASTLVAARKLAANGWIGGQETVVLFNTGTGYKYSEAWQKALEEKA